MSLVLSGSLTSAIDLSPRCLESLVGLYTLPTSLTQGFDHAWGCTFDAADAGAVSLLTELFG